MSAANNKTLEKTLRDLQAQINDAAKNRDRLRVCAGGSKHFLYPDGDDETRAKPCIVDYAGIVSYQPSELVVTARASTPLREIHAVLADSNQMLGFEPPAFADTATIGGTVAAGLSGSARPYAGSIRDAVLGVKLLTGRGEVVRFGGEVMKNVAGYDVSRLMVGSMGSLGIILEVSLRVTPRPPVQSYWARDCDEVEAFKRMAQLRQTTLPITGIAYDSERLHLRLAGSEIAVQQAVAQIKDFSSQDGAFWPLLNEQKHRFFERPENLWRMSLPFEQENLMRIPAPRIWDWGGELCWAKTEEAARKVDEIARAAHGSARLFRGQFSGEAARVDEPIQEIRSRLRAVFDPNSIFSGNALW